MRHSLYLILLAGLLVGMLGSCTRRADGTWPGSPTAEERRYARAHGCSYFALASNHCSDSVGFYPAGTAPAAGTAPVLTHTTSDILYQGSGAEQEVIWYHYE